MKSILKKLLILLSVLISLHACGKEDILDEQRDYALIKAMEAVKKQNRKDIDEEALEKHAIII